MALPSPALSTPQHSTGAPAPRAHAATIAASVARLIELNPQHRIGPRSADSGLIGTTVHAVIAILAPIADQFTTAGLVEVTIGLSRGLCAPGRMHRRNSILVAGFAADYLRGPARPRQPWECTDSEAVTDGGFVDLVWRHRDTGRVFVDELKTTRVPRRTPDQGWLTQTVRYAEAGQSRWGDEFIGVRLVPLGSMHLAALVLPDGSHRAVVPSVADPIGGAGSW